MIDEMRDGDGRDEDVGMRESRMREQRVVLEIDVTCDGGGRVDVPGCRQ
jgi:hypothetical protein